MQLYLFLGLVYENQIVRHTNAHACLYSFFLKIRKILPFLQCFSKFFYWQQCIIQPYSICQDHPHVLNNCSLFKPAETLFVWIAISAINVLNYLSTFEGHRIGNSKYFLIILTNHTIIQSLLIACHGLPLILQSLIDWTTNAALIQEPSLILLHIKLWLIATYTKIFTSLRIYNIYYSVELKEIHLFCFKISYLYIII